MKSRRSLSVISLLLVAAIGCRAKPKSRAAASRPQQHSEVRSLDNADPRPALLDPPPMLGDEAPPPKPLGQPWETPEPVVLTPEDEKVRAALPFAPAIAMDPVDGSKISILAHTPTFEYKGRIFYFKSEDNKKQFASSPDQYIKGLFSRL